MAKTSTPAPKSKAAKINEEVLSQDTAATNQLAVLTTAAHANAVVMAQQLGYDGQLTTDALEDGIRFYQRRSVESCLALGSCLLLLKEMSLHGEFEPRVEALGFSLSGAKRYMQAAAKTAKSPKLGDLSARAKSMSTFLELLVLDDQVIDNLAEMDDFERMSASEVRAAARELKADSEAHEQLMADKNKAMDKLRAQVKRIKSAPPDDVLADLMKEVAVVAAEAMGVIQGKLRLGFTALAEHGAEHGGDTTQVMTGHLAQIQQMCNALRDDFNLGDPVGDGTPAYLKWAAQQAKKA